MQIDIIHAWLTFTANTSAIFFCWIYPLIRGWFNTSITQFHCWFESTAISADLKYLYIYISIDIKQYIFIFSNIYSCKEFKYVSHRFIITNWRGDLSMWTTLCSHYINPVDHLTYGFSGTIEFHGNTNLFETQLQSRDFYKILHMPWQQKFVRSHVWHLNYIQKVLFTIHLDFDWKFVNKMDLWRLHSLFTSIQCRAANLWNIISVFCWKNFRILRNFSVSLNLFLTRLKTFIRQLPIYSGGTHPLPVETLVDSFGTTGTGSEARKRVTTTCGREKIECFGD